jgi:ubiquinone/menaquinone biosynthesis C-methylase UbiE
MDIVDFFDQKQYFAAHPDLDRAFKDGRISSGLRHYILHGAAERRKAPRDERLETFLQTKTLDVVPPDSLIQRVHGSGGVASFVAAGKVLAFDLDSAIQMAGVPLPKGANVLDFGCGPGRVAQWFQKIHPDINLHGCDIDPEPIFWAKENISGQFVQSGHAPPLPYADSQFDLVYSVSVFTHLPEDMQFQFLEELQRVTRPGGYLLLTTHGASLASRSRPLTEEERTLETKGFLYRVGGGVSGLPGFYQNTFHTSKYIHRTWSRYFDIRFILKQGINAHQDLVICRAR